MVAQILVKFATQGTVGRAAYTKGQLLPPAQEQGAAPELCFCFGNFVPPRFVSHSHITGHLPNNPKLICIIDKVTLAVCHVMPCLVPDPLAAGGFFLQCLLVMVHCCMYRLSVGTSQ